MHTVLPLQEAIGVGTLNHNVGRLQPRLFALQVVQDFIGEPVALRPAGVHPVEHLTPVLGLGTAGSRVEGHQRIVAVVFPGEQRLQPGFLHALGQLVKSLLELWQHRVVIFLQRHLADGQKILQLGRHGMVFLQLCLQELGLDHDFLRPLRVIPEARRLLHGVKPLQLVPGPLQIERDRQRLQLRLQIVQLQSVIFKFNHSHRSHSFFISRLL